MVDIPGKDAVTYELYLKAADAIKDLDKIIKNAESVDDAFDNAVKGIENFRKSAGLSLSATEALFKRVIAQADKLRRQMETPAGKYFVSQSPDLQKISEVQDPFGGINVGKTAGFKEINSRVKDLWRGLEIAARKAEAIENAFDRAADNAQRLKRIASTPGELFGKNFSYDEFSKIINQFKAIQNLNFGNVKNYGDNVQALMGNIKNLSAQTKTSFQDVGKYIQQNFKNIPTVAVKDALTGIDNEVRGLGNSFRKTTGMAKGLQSVLNLIRGILVAIGVFRVFQFIEESIRKAYDAARQMELALYKIVVAERALSKAGVDVTTKELRDMADNLTKTYSYISKIDATKMVADLSILTKDLGLSIEQLRDLTIAIPILAANAGITIEQATDQVVNGLANSGKGWKDLGVIVDANIIKQNAVSAGLVESKDKFDKLTAEQQQQIEVLSLLDILNESVAEGLAAQGDYAETADKKIRDLSATWEDFLATLGGVGIPLLGTLSEYLITYIDLWKFGINIIKFGIIEITALVTSFGRAVSEVFSGNIKNVKEFGRVAVEEFLRVEQETLKYFGYFDEDSFKISVPGLGDAGITINERFREMGDEIDTPTKKVEELGDAISDLSQVDGFDDLVEDLIELQNKIEETKQEFEREWGGSEITIDAALNFDINSSEFSELGREVQDYIIKIQRLVEDYARKRRDIIVDANQKITEANRKYHNQQIDDEARFQEQLRQLREKYLFNLEDALRERDARQVLRLQRQYQMDKEALINEHKLSQQEAARQHQEDLERIRQERDDRLAELAEEERIRLEQERQDFELEQQRAKEDHDLEMQQLNQEISDRLMEFARAIGEEYQLNEQGVQKLYELLNQYYGPSGTFDQLYKYSYESMVAQAQAMLAQVNAIISQAKSQMSLIPTTFPSDDFFFRHSQQSIGNQAKGGTYLATRATKAVFGESGPEIASFIPLGSSMSLPGIAPSSGNNMSGRLDIEILLSPDLESRIISSTLNETANVITRIQRSK